jgi:hypothetical protein
VRRRWRERRDATRPDVQRDEFVLVGSSPLLAALRLVLDRATSFVDGA